MRWLKAMWILPVLLMLMFSALNRASDLSPPAENPAQNCILTDLEPADAFVGIAHECLYQCVSAVELPASTETLELLATSEEFADPVFGIEMNSNEPQNLVPTKNHYNETIGRSATVYETNKLICPIARLG